MADSSNPQSQNEPARRGDGTILEESDAPRNPMKRALDTVVEAQKQDRTTQTEKKEPVIRGDGTVLPERSDTEPKNRYKRVLDTKEEAKRGEL